MTAKDEARFSERASIFPLLDALDLGKQPHGNHHDAGENGDGIFRPDLAQRLLIPKGRRGNEDDKDREDEFDSRGHSYPSSSKSIVIDIILPLQPQPSAPAGATSCACS